MRNRLKKISVFLLYMLLMFSCCIAPAYASALHDDLFIGRWNLVPDEQNEEGELILAVDGTGTMRCNTDHLFHGQNWEILWDSGSGLNIKVVEDSSGYTNDVPGGLFDILGCRFEFNYDSSVNSIIFYDCCGDLHRFEYDDSWKTEAVENIPKVWMIEIGDPQDYDYGYFFLNADGNGQCELRSTVYKGDELVENLIWYSSFSWEPRMTGFEMKLDRNFYNAQLEKDKTYEVRLSGFAGHYIEDASEVKSAELEGDYGDIHMRRVEATPIEVEMIPSYESDNNQNVEYMTNKTKFSVGDRVYLGKYEQDNNRLNGAEDIQWRILDIEDGRALLLSEYALDGLYYDLGYGQVEKEENLLSKYIPDGFDYHSENWRESLQSKYILDWLDEDTGYWKGSYVRAWLNEGFLKCAFSETEASNIQKSLCKNDNNDLDDTNNTMDWIFLLSADEVERYMPIRKDRRVLATEYARDDNKVYEQNNGYSEWWLRSVDYKDDYVMSDGYIMNTTNKIRTGIRPAMWYKLPEGATIEEKDAYDSITVLKEENFAVGDTLNFGAYEQDYDSTNGSEPITWQILDIDEDNVALAISVNVLNRMAFFEHGYGEQSLEKSELVGWLNKEFVSQAFTDEEITYMQNFPLDDVRASFKVGILLTSEVEQFMSVLKEGLEVDTEYVKFEYEEYGGSNVGWWVYKHRDPEDMEESLPYLAEEEIGEYKLNLGKGEGMIVSYESGEIEYYDNMYSAGIRPLIRIQLNHSLKQNGTTGGTAE